jgi:hypothetical protein
LAVGVLVLIVATGIWLAQRGGTAVAPTSPAERLDLTMDLDRIPYLHHNPDGVRFGEAARLLDYALSAQQVQAGDVLTLTMRWSGITLSDGVCEAALVSPADHLFGVSLVLAASEQRLTSDQTQHVLPIPANTQRGIYLLTVRVHNQDREIRPVTSRSETLGTTYLVPVRIESELHATGNEPILERFGDRIALSEVETVQPAAGALDVLLTWRVDAPPLQNYKTALRLRDPSGWEVARLDVQPGYGFYPTSMWRAGELVYDRYVLPIDDGTPPGTNYSLDVTLYEAATLQPIGSAKISNVAITRPTVRTDYPVLHAFGPALALSSVQLSKVEAQQGEKLTLLLKWAARDRMEQDYQYRVALLRDGGAVLEYQALPLASDYPTSLWPQNAVVASRGELRLPPDIPVGQYRVAVAVEDMASGEEVGTFDLPDPVRVAEVERNFAIPEMQVAVDADFGAQVRLLGYDLQREAGSIRLTLHWQALTAMAKDYKVFVHLFDPQTETIVAQQDLWIGGEIYPSTRWVANEVVSNTIELGMGGVPEGDYRLAVGLYTANGRLPIAAAVGFTVSADRLVLSQTDIMP